MRLYQRIFRQVMARYHLAKNKSDRNLKGCFAGVVQVCESDLVCDVELAARRALSPKDHKLFVTFYLDVDKEAEAAHLAREGKEAHDKVKFHIQCRVGKIFQAKKIYPVGVYMSSVHAHPGAA